MVELPTSVTHDPREIPVLNTPYEATKWHWRIGDDNRAMSERIEGRRPSLFMLPVPKENYCQLSLAVNVGNELNKTVNAIRKEVAEWRLTRYEGATKVSKELLVYWQRPGRRQSQRLFFAQIEALETLIWLTEIAAAPALASGKRQLAKRLLEEVNTASRKANDGLERFAVKMAPGTGKTVVMGMVIVWHALNNYHTSFLVITPGLTVRDRLEPLKPTRQGGAVSVYKEMDLVPRRYQSALNQSQVCIVNAQKFKHKSSDAMLRNRSSKICVLNDEAHHCYLPVKGGRNSFDKSNNKPVALWFNAIKSRYTAGNIGVIYDFSATPMFIDNKDPRMFPWVVSDFSLMDAIEAGLVKIPRVPTNVNVSGGRPAWRNLYKNVGVKNLEYENLPPDLKDAAKTLYEDYKDEYDSWKAEDKEAPPVFIVVASTIDNADVLYRYLSGTRENSNSTNFDLFSNYKLDGSFTANLNTLLVHSKPKDDGKTTSRSSQDSAMRYQAKQLRQMAERLSGDYDKLDDELLVREAFNTVGSLDKLGADIRCVVSVSMLTEGWDTRTVTHVLGYRAFDTLLLCEQVTGRALRRTSYDEFDDHGHLKPQFANVFGVPFDFLPDNPVDDGFGEQFDDDQLLIDATALNYEVKSVAGREDLRIEFPCLTSYAGELANTDIKFDSPAITESLDLGLPDSIAVEVEGVAGRSKTLTNNPTADDSAADHQASRPQLSRLRQLLAMLGRWGKQVKQWLRALLTGKAKDKLAQPDEVTLAPTEDAVIPGDFDKFGRIGTTKGIKFETDMPNRFPQLLGAKTPKTAEEPMTKLSELNVAACDSGWEVTVAELIDNNPATQAWVRNFQLVQSSPDSRGWSWTIPYEFDGEWRYYEPDFVVRLKRHAGADSAGNNFADAGSAGDNSAVVVHLLVEVKDVRTAESEQKAKYASQWWIPAVRNSPHTPDHLRHWAFVELSDPTRFGEDLDEAIVQATKP